MNIKIAILLCTLLVRPALGAGAAERKEQAAVRAKIEAINLANVDLEAQYWAWRIDQGRDVTYDKLLEYSDRWVGVESSRDTLFAKIKEHLAKRPVPALTKEQDRTQKAYKEEIRKLLSPGRYDQAAIDKLTPDYCIELGARYWARRVQDGEKEILTLMQKWGFKDSQTKQRLLARIEERVKEINPALTKDEHYKHDACGAVLR